MSPRAGTFRQLYQIDSYACSLGHVDIGQVREKTPGRPPPGVRAVAVGLRGRDMSRPSGTQT